MCFAIGEWLTGLWPVLQLLTVVDRSDEAYAQAALGAGNADAYQVVETDVNGITKTESS